MRRRHRGVVFGRGSNAHRLKLVTGVEISTRPVSRSGSRGKAVNRTSRNRAAPTKTPALFRRAMVVLMASSPMYGRSESLPGSRPSGPCSCVRACQGENRRASFGRVASSLAAGRWPEPRDGLGGMMTKACSCKCSTKRLSLAQGWGLLFTVLYSVFILIQLLQ